ncbi:MAG: hypothetical protein LBC75_02720 [Fibromonadaceae bacterium]|jgi:Tfp pilus assembly protein PilF|nr:hypothetical protein [Fibromonadaceae bacterium]
MVSSAEIMNLKRIVAKNPKSLAFAWLADMLRMDKKLDEALLTVNKGLEMYSNFLPGRLARGRILLEKGDLAGARADFEAVAEQDSFCASAQKLFLETSEKLGQPVQTEVYQKILGAIEPGVVVKVKAKTESAGVNAALDDLLSEDDATDDKEDIVISDLLLQTFTNIFEPGKQEQAPDIMPYTPPAPKAQPVPAPKPAPRLTAVPDLDALVNEQLKSKVEDVPDLTGDMDSLLASASSLPPVSGALTPASPPDVDALINEQLKSKVEDIPDLTGDMDSLLASASAAPAKASGPPDIDSLINEQLKSKVDSVPDLTGDMDSLLASASAPAPAKASGPPDIDSLINEQLKSKVDSVPDLTGDMDSLLASASDILSASGTLTAPSAPDIDSLIEEQLTSRVDNIPDLTGDISSLLSSMPEPALEPPLAAGYSHPAITFPPVSNTPSSPSAPSTPDLDAIINEQLKSKVEDVPDLTGDINSLLKSNTLSSSGPPDLDALINEQLTPKMENLPDLTGDIDSLLKSNIPSSSGPPDLDALINEQLTPKMENLPDLTGDISSLLASMPASGSDAEPELMPYVPPSQADSSIAQKPTLTLAELYMDQGLPQKAAGVYRELLSKDPNNEDLKAKLALAETQM